MLNSFEANRNLGFHSHLLLSKICNWAEQKEVD